MINCEVFVVALEMVSATGGAGAVPGGAVVGDGAGAGGAGRNGAGAGH